MGWRTVPYGPDVTTSGSTFSDMGRPPVTTEVEPGQTATANPETKMASPMPSSHGSLEIVCP